MDTAKSSPNSTQSPEITSKELEDQNNVKVKVLSERLSSVVLDIRAKDDLVKQHSKVAEEAVLGWEKAEKEIASLKAQLNAATAKNSALEDRLVHLDGALKECVRQLRRAKDEQDQTVQDALAQQARQWESHKADLELRIVELTARLEAKSERSAVATTDGNTGSRLAALEKENSALKVQLLAKTEELELRTIEKELNRRAAETASKQQLEGIKKVAKLQAECRRLQAAARRPPVNVELRRSPSSAGAESVTDCQSDCSDSWASALITELDQFRNDKSGASTRTASLAAADIGVMDDFLEMEKLASANGSSKGDAVEDASGQLSKLEEKARKLAAEKAEREKALHEAQRELRTCRHRVMVAEEKSAELQRQLNLANGEKHAMEAEVEAAEAKRGELEGKLELARAEIAGLLDKGRILEERLESEKALTLELAAKYQDMEALGAEKRELIAQLETSRSEAKKLSDKIALMERKLEVEKALSIRLATKCHGIDALEAKKKGVELELESALEEIASLQKNASSLELQVEEEKASSAALAIRCQELDELRSQLESSNAQIVDLNEKVKMLEDVIEKQRPVTTELESQLQSRHAEIGSLKVDMSLLQKKLDSQKNLSSAYISALGASETEKKELASRFELREKEAEELRGKMSLLEEQIHKERAQSSEFAVKCQKMEEQMSYRSLLGHQPVKSVAIKDLQIRKETELAKAAGKLADCQKTIASLSTQLKSLADFDELLPETETSGTDSAEAWHSDLKLIHPATASYPTQIGCLAVT
ncbi:filament-like plant protein 3 isoform X2 [Sorghum bicolor]|uniref:filament-like plant protein 3 isoform X2 n=1 Tax=Sorghum bicolor TaxID=4558 RepID=UPI000B426AD7|nr:filament-like plant protein 3 isoform X2 [Sorghum bicolor]|eukprot:XP_021308720.1 filament-like plant protein 3 isoform X2 [Sorghum bicolor]